MEALKTAILSRGIQMPPSFMERDWLKWIQADFYDVEKATVKLLKHIEWL